MVIIMFCGYCGNGYHHEINESKASNKQKLFYKLFIFFSKVVVLTRSIIFEAYYPSLIFVNRDKERFFAEFTTAQEYIIPFLDAATFALSLLHAYLIYQTVDLKSEFFFTISRYYPLGVSPESIEDQHNPYLRRSIADYGDEVPYVPNLRRSLAAD